MDHCVSASRRHSLHRSTDASYGYVRIRVALPDSSSLVLDANIEGADKTSRRGWRRLASFAGRLASRFARRLDPHKLQTPGWAGLRRLAKSARRRIRLRSRRVSLVSGSWSQSLLRCRSPHKLDAWSLFRAPGFAYTSGARNPPSRS